MKKVIYVIVVILLLAMCSYLYFNKGESNKEPEIETLGGRYDEFVSSLYNIVYNHNFSREMTNFYRSEKVTYEDLSNEEKLLTIFNMGFIKRLNIDNPAVHGWGDFKKEDIENLTHEIFGPDASVEFEDIIKSITFRYKDGIYESVIDNSLNPNVYDYSEFLFAEKIGDKVYIFDKYIRITGYATFPEEDVGIYGSSDEKIIIDDNITNEQLVEMISNYSNPEYPRLLDEEIMAVEDNYEGKVLTYKHTFQEDENGNYYWVSSEPVL